MKAINIRIDRVQPIMPAVIYYSPEEVFTHNQEHNLWVIFEGNVYDVTNFAENHPGGKELLLEYAGRDITEAFYGLHQHSLYAVQTLGDHKVGSIKCSSNVINTNKDARGKRRGTTHDHQMAENKKIGLTEEMLSRKDDGFLDLTKPLMPQVWRSAWSRNYYIEQIHIPRHTLTSPLFFNSPVLEIFTKTPWYGVLMVWIPVIILLINYAYATLSFGWTVHLLVDGFALWTLYEYGFHRFIFHMDERLPENKLAILLHFLMHGVHHFLPMDKYRLVMPPLMMSMFSTMVGFGWCSVLGGPRAAALMAGSFVGYLCYDMIHYYSHHGSYLNGYLRKMKKYHMDHHYVDPNLGFGVSSLIWDAVLDTLLPIR